MNNGKIVSDDTPENTFEKIDILTSSKLDIPFNLKVYDLAKQNESINQKKELMNALWELSLKK